VSARPLYRDASTGSRHCDAGMAVLIEMMASRCRHLTVAMSTSPHPLDTLDHRVDALKAEFHDLPAMPTTVRGIWRVADTRSAIRQIEASSDVLIVQLPFASTFALLAATRPRVYHIFSDLLETVTNSSAYSGLARIPAIALGNLVDLIQQRLVQRIDSRAVVNGRQLFDRYRIPRGRAIVSSTLRHADIMSVTRSRPRTAPFRILFVGQLRPEKGVDVLREAYKYVLRSMPDTELHIVGNDAGSLVGAGTGTAGDASSRQTTYHGHLPFGPELFRCYADADVLVLPSRSEGTPRVLVEARAFGCPVVATTVGGIPTSVEDGVTGLLVPSGNATATADAILRIARDPGLAIRLRDNGLAFARRCTADAFADALCEEAAIVCRNSASAAGSAAGLMYR
jgi:glycosyltransferase involved in cell wall biosynthesis